LLYLWLKMLEYAGAFAGSSTVAKLFLMMGKTLFQYMIVLLMFVLGFGHTMFLMGIDDPDFINVGSSVIRMYRGLMGDELPYPSIATSTGNILAPILYFVFTMTGTILLLNLLIALMSSVFSTVTENIKTEFYINRGQFIAKKLQVYILTRPLKYIFLKSNEQKEPWATYIHKSLFPAIGPNAALYPHKRFFTVEKLMDVSQTTGLQISVLKSVIENLKLKMEYSFGGLEENNSSSTKILSQMEARVFLNHSIENYNHKLNPVSTSHEFIFLL
jgi:hypothetical protein